MNGLHLFTQYLPEQNQKKTILAKFTSSFEYLAASLPPKIDGYTELLPLWYFVVIVAFVLP